MSVSEGRRRRNEGVYLVDRHTPLGWKLLFSAAVKKLITRGTEFTAEEIREICGDPPNHCNAFGAAMLGAVKTRTIEWTGETRPANRPTRHGSTTLKVWRGVNRC